MPNVVGKTLDVALSDIERAGVDDEVEIVGGGTFGVVKESNWQVCNQLPAAGQEVVIVPRLTVNRSCDEGSPESASQSTETPADEQATEPTAADPESEEAVLPPSTATASSAPAVQDESTLTVENSADLAALLAGSESDYELIEAFAANYLGRTIEFDGNISAMSNHGEQTTRYDILILAGDFSETSATGPYFQFRDVNVTSDLGLSGSNVPDAIGPGTNLRILAKVGVFDRDRGLFYLEPISTHVR